MKLLIINLSSHTEKELTTYLSEKISTENTLTVDFVQAGFELNANYTFLKALSSLKDFVNLHLYDAVAIFDGDFSLFELLENKLEKLKYESVGVICDSKHTNYNFGHYLANAPDLFIGQGWYDLEKISDTQYFRWSGIVSSLIFKNEIKTIKLLLHKSGHVSTNNVHFIIDNEIINHSLQSGPNELELDISFQNPLSTYKSIFISTNIFIPHQLDKTLNDKRQLGLQLEKVEYQIDDWKEKTINDIMLFNKMYYSDELRAWRKVCGLDLPEMHTVKTVNSYNFITKPVVLEPLIAKILDITSYIENASYENRLMYFNDITNILGYITDQKLELQLIG